MLFQITRRAFLKYGNSKRRSKENIGQIFIEDGHPTNRDDEEVEALNAFFASTFNNTNRLALLSPLSLVMKTCINDFSVLVIFCLSYKLFSDI